MKLEQIKEETNERFRRLTGVKHSTFDVMVVVLEKAELLLKSQGGKPNKLSIENRLLMTLEYLREYRTYFHISRSYGIKAINGCISEMNCLSESEREQLELEQKVESLQESLNTVRLEKETSDVQLSEVKAERAQDKADLEARLKALETRACHQLS